MTTNWPNKYPAPKRRMIADGIERGESDERISCILNVNIKYVEWYRDFYENTIAIIRQPQDAREAD
ncbi:unnamed protein product [marine sediment metagenome]|uniref:Uncharacterized protein n=1 Tax=marine sediment metagenome TaxID=412755 RepID=X0RPG3_9ZZZZ